MKKIDYKIYHETLGAAVNNALESIEKAEIILADSNIQNKFEFDGIQYGNSKEAHSEIKTIGGKPTHKFAHVSIYRMETGRYELTIYVL